MILKSILACTLFWMFSCTSVTKIASQEIKTKKAEQNLTFSGKIPLLPVIVDQKQANFIFDTGATVSALTDSTLVSDFKDKSFDFFLSTKGADGKKVKNKKVTVGFSSSLFESSNKVLTFIRMPIPVCSSKKAYSGIVGMDVFFDQGLSLQMDFSNNLIANISEDEFQKLILEGLYKRVKSDCKLGQIKVYFNVEGKEYPFLLDTGYTGSLIFPSQQELGFKGHSKIEMEGSIYQTVSNLTQGKETVYEKISVELADTKLEVKANVSSSIKAQNIGIDFIKGFDWLIDYKRNKVYVKRNQNKIESTFSRKVSYYAKVQSEKLVVAIKEKSQTRYQLGDQITAVNGHKVLPENICQLMDLLNKTEDWNTLSLDVISAQ